MGYDLHITRRENWFDEGDDIALDEWLVVAQADPDLTVAEDGSADMRGPKEQLWPLWWYDGVVQTKNPEVGLIAKMVRRRAPKKNKKRRAKTGLVAESRHRARLRESENHAQKRNNLSVKW